jgi:hypothetical protein
MKRLALTMMTILVFLSTMGFNCVNDSFQVPVSLPLSLTVLVNGGNTGTSGGTVTLVLADLIDNSFVGKIQSVRFYDVQVSSIGTYSGHVSGVVAIDEKQLLAFNGNWSDFNTQQSLLQGSQFLTPAQAGLTQLQSVLNNFKSNSSTTTILGGMVTTSGGTVPSGLQLKFTLLCQVDAEISTK